MKKLLKTEKKCEKSLLPLYSQFISAIELWHIIRLNLVVERMFSTTRTLLVESIWDLLLLNDCNPLNCFEKMGYWKWVNCWMKIGPSRDAPSPCEPPFPHLPESLTPRSYSLLLQSCMISNCPECSFSYLISNSYSSIIALTHFLYHPLFLWLQ